jgi:hypothetical protein
MTRDFISEDDLDTFEGWLKFQHFDAATMAPDLLSKLQDHFKSIKGTPKVGRMKLKPLAAGEYRWLRSVADAMGKAFAKT